MNNHNNNGTKINRLLAVILFTTVVALISTHLYYFDNFSSLMNSVVSNALSSTLVALVVLIVYRLWIQPEIIPLSKEAKSDENRLEAISENIDYLVKISAKQHFEKSNRDHYKEVFTHYLSLENNCLDFLALCDGKKVLDQQQHPVFSDRLKIHNVKRSAEKQSSEYLDLAGEYTKNLGDINQRLGEIDQGGLKKVAFDVEVGGIFYYFFNDNKARSRYLFGATVSQQSMDNGLAYREMESIFDELKNKVI